MADRRESAIFSSARSITANRALSLSEVNPAIRSIRLSHLWRRELRRNMGAYVSDCPNHIAGRNKTDAGADDDVDAPAFFVYQSMQEKLPVVRLLIRFYRFFCGYPAFSCPVRRLQKHISVIPR